MKAPAPRVAGVPAPLPLDQLSMIDGGAPPPRPPPKVTETWASKPENQPAAGIHYADVPVQRPGYFSSLHWDPRYNPPGGGAPTGPLPLFP